MHRQLIYVLVFIFSLSTVTLFWPVNDSQCDSEAFLASNTQKFQVQATKVVFQPWRGEHNVYAIFMVPDKYKKAPFFVLTVKGFGHECSKPYGYSQKYNDLSAEPGTYLVRDYMRTRTALRLILQGLYGQINDKQNWTLTYPQPQDK
ncbi:hypothetical protein NIES2100_52350 [Calothrix sp. NIES-2100]|uniref:hypothetical protein n=1 Tax=Calothrix sp. NIES-2100 TaxID=1954172 RepID=UPI000B5FFA1B|nr:hypothetical protein NIES2100_52350 [Calothrix sp. NIES-2100]